MDYRKGTNMAKALLTTMQLCMRYNVSVKSFDHWKLRDGFPRDAMTYTKEGQLWDYTKIDSWLKARPINKTGPEARWRTLVGYPFTTVGRRVRTRAHIRNHER
jgi:hypothetical protein